MVVVVPQADQIQLDIDNHASREIWERVRPVLESRFDISCVEEHPSKSGGIKKHVTVTFMKPLMSPMERILLQACLGSDPVRELLSYYRVLERDPVPTLFIEKREVIEMYKTKMPVPQERQLAA